MTTEDLARRALPYARQALREARPQAKAAVGPLGWLTLWPAWALLTGPLLPLLVRIAVELAVGLAAPRLLPILIAVNGLSACLPSDVLSESQRLFLRELSSLLAQPRETFCPPVCQVLASPERNLASA